MDLIAGSPFAGDSYLMLGSVSGTMPGVLFGGQVIPLHWDSYMAATLGAPGSALWPGSIGTLDAQGRATASLVLPAKLSPALAGLGMHHAFVAVDPIGVQLTHVSNPVGLLLR